MFSYSTFVCLIILHLCSLIVKHSYKVFYYCSDFATNITKGLGVSWRGDSGLKKTYNSTKKSDLADWMAELLVRTHRCRLV